MVFRNLTFRVTCLRSFGVIAALVVLSSGSTSAYAQAVSITDPTNTPVWEAGSPQNVTWTTFDPNNAIVDYRIQIAQCANPGIVYLDMFSFGGGQVSSDNFPVPTPWSRGPGSGVSCYLIIYANDKNNNVVAYAEISIVIIPPPS